MAPRTDRTTGWVEGCLGVEKEAVRDLDTRVVHRPLDDQVALHPAFIRSEEHTSELQSR